MPLECFTGTAVDALLVRARRSLGPEAEILSVRTLRGPNGAPLYQVLAIDAAGATEQRRQMARDGGTHPLLKSRPGPGDLSRGRDETRGPRVLAFVGPTGVGKTTTIAKLATHPDHFRQDRVGLLCLDTYRVGAVEQIRTYAEIAGLPLEVAYDEGDLSVAIRRLADRDLVLVDTPGRGPRNHGDIEQVRRWLNVLEPHEVHLVLPTGLQGAHVRRTVQAYRGHGVTHLLATKLDEAPDDWSLFDAAARDRMPMRWVADGQEVPRDLRAAAPRLLAAVAALRLGAGVIAEEVVA